MIRNFWTSSKTHRRDLQVITVTFFVALTLSNVLHEAFGFTLVELFDSALNTFHNFCRALLDWTVFFWARPLVELIIHVPIYLANIVLGASFEYPRIRIAPWYIDLSMLSLALTRVFDGADLVVPRNERAKAEEAMPSNWKSDMYLHEGKLWGGVHRVSDNLTAIIWNAVDIMEKLIWILTKNARIGRLARTLFIAIFGAILWWGYIRLFGYILNISASRGVDSPIMRVRRKLFKNFGYQLLAAVCACAVFLIINGFFAESAQS